MTIRSRLPSTHRIQVAIGREHNYWGPNGVDQWWMRSGVAGFADDAAEHFYLPERYTDPFGNTTTLSTTINTICSSSRAPTRSEIGRKSLLIRGRLTIRLSRVGAGRDRRHQRQSHRSLASMSSGWSLRSRSKEKVTKPTISTAIQTRFANPSLDEVLDHFDLPPLTADQTRNRFSPSTRQCDHPISVSLR